MRYLNKISVSIAVLILVFYVGVAQNKTEKPKKIDRQEIIKDHYKKSNVLDPDTLTGVEKIVFDNFASWTQEEIKETKAIQLKKEFEKIGIITNDKERFQDAYFFFRDDLLYHKISRKQCKYFEDRYGK